MSESSPSYFKEAISLVTRTLPFVGVNVAVYGVFFGLSLIWFGIWGGLAYLMARLGLGVVAVVFVVIGFGAGAALVKFARRYLLYMVKGAHIAAVTELLKDGELPGGMGQFQYGRQVIEERFKDVSILFGIDVMVNASLKALQRKLLRISRWIPLPGGAKKAVGVVTEILNRSLTYVDEAILSYAISLGQDNVWDSARHGVILYAQSFKPILITAAKVWVMGKVIGFVLFLFFLAPAIVVMLAIDAIIVQVVAVVLALVAAWALKAALFEPFAMTYTLVTYHHTIAGQTPDPDWDERLQGVSSKYRELVGKAEEAKQSSPQPAAQPSHSA